MNKKDHIYSAVHLNDNSLDLRKKAHWVWRETLAIHRRAPETRLASSLSPIELFVALYYGGIIGFDALVSGYKSNKFNWLEI